MLLCLTLPLAASSIRTCCFWTAKFACCCLQRQQSISAGVIQPCRSHSLHLCRQHQQSHQAAQDWHQRGSTTSQVRHLQQHQSKGTRFNQGYRRLYARVAFLLLTLAACSVLEEMLAKLQLQEPGLSDQSARPAVHDSTETLHEATLQLTGQHGIAHTGADYMTPAGARWAYSKVPYSLCHSIPIVQAHRIGRCEHP